MFIFIYSIISISLIIIGLFILRVKMLKDISNIDTGRNKGLLLEIETLTIESQYNKQSIAIVFMSVFWIIFIPIIIMALVIKFVIYIINLIADKYVSKKLEAKK